MRTTQGRTFQSLKAVRTFLDANVSALGAVVTSGARKRLDDVVTALDEQATLQSGNTLAVQQGTRQYRALRQALLRDHMAPIAKIAASELPATPELEPLRMPRGAPSPERLKALATGMARAAEPHKDVFTTAGLADDFIDQLNAAADAMVQSATARRQVRVVRVSATSGIKLLLSTGRRLVHAIDAMVKSALRDTPELLAGWNRAKRVELLGGQPGSAPPAPSGPTLAPAPAA